MTADIVLYNGNVHTLDDSHPHATALALRCGRILAVGDDAAMRDLLGPGGKQIDLGGRTVVPGMTDAHVHLFWYAAYLHNVDLRDTTSPREVAERVAARAAQTPPGEWIRGHAWAQDKFPGKAFPTAAQLDELVPDHPAFLTNHSYHAAWINTAALRAAGIDANTPDPPSGQIGRDEAGNPTGVLFEKAMDLVDDIIPEPTPEVAAERVRVAIARAHRGGLTGIHDFDGSLAFQTYELLKERGELTLRIVKNILVPMLDHAIAVGLRWGFGDDMLRIGGVKTFADGALGPRTAWMIEPYEGEPENYGMRVTDPEEMMENVSRASAAGLPSTIHAIGDRAVHEVLDVYELVRKQEAARGVTPSMMRHRIEHVQIIHPDDANRLAELGVIASMQPNHATSDMLMADAYWGDRADYSYNIRLQLDAGARVAFGSDAPIEPIEVLPNIHAAVTRCRPDGSPGEAGWRTGENSRRRLTVDEALRGFTQGPAYAAGMEDRLGMLAPGYLADLVVLGEDPYTVDPMALYAVPVLGTMVGGEWVYREF